MKTKLLLAFIGLFLFLHSVSTAATGIRSDSLSLHIQADIYDAFVSDITKNTDLLKKLKLQLADMDTGKENKVLTYWRSYLQFYRTILYTKIGDKSTAKEEVNLGIELLENLSNKTSEDFALLARLESLALQFSDMDTMNLYKLMHADIQRALQLEKDNLRANFVYGSIDFYTPPEFGGGKYAEEYLLRAIALPDDKDRGDFSPSWGKDEAYELLIKLYLGEGEPEKAKAYYEQAVRIYPHNYRLSALKEKVYK